VGRHPVHRRQQVDLRDRRWPELRQVLQPAGRQAASDGAKELDPAKLRDSFNQADEIMSKEAYVLPLYQKPVFIAVYSDYVYVRNNPTAEGQTYNIDEWAMKA
jgi:ABC-type oligopeptide transport system substrate-binding subunit